MRVLTGKHKGRLINMPRGIRPTQNLVRKAIFDILGDIEGLSFLELYAGSGAVGLEALSRGVRELVFVESNRDCVLAIQKNIESLKLKECSLLPKEAEAAIKAFFKSGRKFDLIFLDPPYHNSLAAPNPKGWIGVPLSAVKKTLQALAAYDILAPYGLVVAQHFKKENLPDTLGILSLFKQKIYGDTALSFYRKA
jgi:16S rRNA (guanine966-N2)-methyltransferase